MLSAYNLYYSRDHAYTPTSSIMTPGTVEQLKKDLIH